MELRHLRYLCAVVDCGGISQAARRLRIAQSAVSEQIRDLEQEIGVPLLSRERRQIALTPHGEIFLAEARAILTQAERAVDLAQRSLRGEIGSLSIGFMVGATALYFPQVIHQYRMRYPGVRLSLHEMSPVQQMEALEKGEIDIGFTRSLDLPLKDTIRTECLNKEPLVAAVPKGHPLCGGPIPLEALATEHFILYQREAWPGLFDIITGLCRAAGFSPRVTTSPMIHTVFTLVSAGEGVALVPESVRHFQPKGVVFCRIRPDEVRLSMVVAWRTVNSSTAQQAFLDLVRESKPHIKRVMRGNR